VFFQKKTYLGETSDELLGDACYPFAKYMFIVFFAFESYILANNIFNRFS
jgi:hypothetical protein